MKKLLTPKRDYLKGFLLFIGFFMSLGWYSAEAENEVLREEQAIQCYAQHIHHDEAEQHDY